MSTEITQFLVMKILFEVDTFEVLESPQKETEKSTWQQLHIMKA